MVKYDFCDDISSGLCFDSCLSFLHLGSQNFENTIHGVLITCVFSVINTSMRLKMVVES